MEDLTDPTAQLPGARPASSNAFRSPSASTGSPRAVPVPWASIQPTVPGAAPDRRHASRMSAACESGLGTVNPLVRPVWLVPVPRITPRMWSPSASARRSGLSRTAPTPSPGTYPVAPFPKLRQRPSSARKRPCANWRYFCGWMVTFTPPASAMVLSPRRMLSTARCTAMSDDEQAVSTARLGPVRSKQYETRLATAACMAVGATPCSSKSW